MSRISVANLMFNSDNYEDLILFPIEDGYGLGTKYDWNLWTVPQTYLDGAARPYDMGRGVGGGSLINGMCCKFPGHLTSLMNLNGLVRCHFEP